MSKIGKGKCLNNYLTHLELKHFTFGIELFGHFGGRDLGSDESGFFGLGFLLLFQFAVLGVVVFTRPVKRPFQITAGASQIAFQQTVQGELHDVGTILHLRSPNHHHHHRGRATNKKANQYK